VDRNLVLCLPRLTVHVSIEADRPGAWFPGPLGPYAAWFSGMVLSRDFERVKVPGNPMKSPFWCLLGDQIPAMNICASKQLNHVKLLLSGLNNLLEGTFHLLVSLLGDPRLVTDKCVNVHPSIL
jgi:hypothetical protein